MNLAPNKQLLLNVTFQSTKYRKKELCVDNKVPETIGDVYCPTCRNEKCVYISTKKTTSFYDCKKSKACCNVLNNPFKDQKPTMVFGGDGTHCFARKTNRDYEKEKPFPFLKKFLRQSQLSTSEPEPKRKLKWVQIWNKGIRFLLANDLSQIFNFHIILFNFNLLLTYTQLTQNHHDLLSLQRRNPVDSRFRTRLCYYCSKWSRPKYIYQLTRITPSCLAIAIVSKARLSSATRTNHSESRGNKSDERRSTLLCGGSRLGH